jgi:phosphoglycerate dehydrogenase-like enzyme
LLEQANTVLTPHLGYVTEENYRLWFAEIIEDIAAFLEGHPIRLALRAPNAPDLGAAG